MEINSISRGLQYTLTCYSSYIENLYSNNFEKSIISHKRDGRPFKQKLTIFHFIYVQAHNAIGLQSVSASFAVIDLYFIADIFVCRFSCRIECVQIRKEGSFNEIQITTVGVHFAIKINENYRIKFVILTSVIHHHCVKVDTRQPKNNKKFEATVSRCQLIHCCLE